MTAINAHLMSFMIKKIGKGSLVKDYILLTPPTYLGALKGITRQAIIEIADFYEVAIMFGVLAAFWVTNPLIGVAIAVAGFFGQIVLDNSFARLTAPLRP